MIIANAIATQQGSFGAVVKLQDPVTKAAVSPVTLQWTLTDTTGTVINSRENVSVSITAGQEESIIYLEGDDLQLLSGESGKRAVRRRLIIEATYHSQLGVNKPAKTVLYFYVENLWLS